MSFFIPDAIAAPAAQSVLHPQSSQVMLLWLVVFAAFLYFFMWRPQSRRAKQHRQLIEALKQGDEVVTSGGFIGKISKVEDNYFVLQLAEKAEVKIQKSAISTVLPNGTIK